MRRFSNFFGAALLAGSLGLSGVAFASVPATVHDQFRDLGCDAAQIRSTARNIERLNNGATTTWREMDRQWNELKPAQEALVQHLDLLQAMKNSMTPAERKALDTAQTNAERISARTTELHATLDQKGIDVGSPTFHVLAHQMVHEANAISQAATLKTR